MNRTLTHTHTHPHTFDCIEKRIFEVPDEKGERENHTLVHRSKPLLLLPIIHKNTRHGIENINTSNSKGRSIIITPLRLTGVGSSGHISEEQMANGGHHLSGVLPDVLPGHSGLGEQESHRVDGIRHVIHRITVDGGGVVDVEGIVAEGVVVSLLEGLDDPGKLLDGGGDRSDVVGNGEEGIGHATALAAELDLVVVGQDLLVESALDQPILVEDHLEHLLGKLSNEVLLILGGVKSLHVGVGPVVVHFVERRIGVEHMMCWRNQRLKAVAVGSSVAKHLHFAMHGAGEGISESARLQLGSRSSGDHNSGCEKGEDGDGGGLDLHPCRRRW